MLEPLAKHAFYGVGGPADEFWKVDTSEKFGEIWAETIALGMPKLVLGKGSNLLMSDRGFRGRVFCLEFDKVTWNKPSLGACSERSRRVTVEVGKNWQSFVEETNAKGFEDLCNLSGIPGNVGGFVRGNAGAFGVETKDFVKSVEYLDENGILQRIANKDCQFGYRESIFKSHPDWCIIRATFELTQHHADATAPSRLLEQTRTLLTERWKKYPPGKSGGSFFKNPSQSCQKTPSNVEGSEAERSKAEGPLNKQPLFAGKLLEDAGAKGDQIGHAQISEKHANFILNLEGKAKQSEILELARKWKKIVFEKTGIQLEPEIFICDEFGERIDL